MCRLAAYMGLFLGLVASTPSVLPFLFSSCFPFNMLDIAIQISPLLDIAIIGLSIVLAYLLATRVFFTSWNLQRDEELETMEMVQEEKLKQIHDLTMENQVLQETIKRAKQNYMKRKIDASTYKKIVEDSQERLLQNQARLKFLK